MVSDQCEVTWWCPLDQSKRFCFLSRETFIPIQCQGVGDGSTQCSFYSILWVQAGGHDVPDAVDLVQHHQGVLLVELLLSCCKSLHTQGELLLLRIEHNTETLPSEPPHSYSIVLPLRCDDRVSPASRGSSCSSVSLHHGGMYEYVTPSLLQHC